MKNFTKMFLQEKHVRKGKPALLSMLFALILIPMGLHAQSAEDAKRQQAKSSSTSSFQTISTEQKKEASAEMKKVQQEEQIKLNATGKEFTRADIMKMSMEELKLHLVKNPAVITDLVNATDEHLTYKNPNLVYLSVDEFNNCSYEKKAHIIKNPDTYIVYARAADFNKMRMSREEFESLSAERKKYVLDSGLYIIK